MTKNNLLTYEDKDYTREEADLLFLEEAENGNDVRVRICTLKVDNQEYPLYACATGTFVPHWEVDTEVPGLDFLGMIGDDFDDFGGQWHRIYDAAHHMLNVDMSRVLDEMGIETDHNLSDFNGNSYFFAKNGDAAFLAANAYEVQLVVDEILRDLERDPAVQIAMPEKQEEILQWRIQMAQQILEHFDTTGEVADETHITEWS